MNSNLDIDIRKVGTSYSEKTLSGDWWFTVFNKDDKRLKEYGINLTDVDFKTHNIIITNGREIKSISYKRNNSFPFNKTDFANVIFKKELFQHTWFIYEIEKIDVYFDERSGEVLIEK